jgi:Fe-S-cluster containining protein
MSKMDAVVPSKLDLNARFHFRCYKGIKCFTKCCSNIDILLTPYDIVRLKNRLGLTSGEFLSRYTFVRIDEKSSHLHVILRMSDERDGKCPFVTLEGCTVYTDRPANCRYYPIGQGTLKKEGKGGPEEEEFYFFVKEPHCFGYNENKVWTIRSWREDQGVDFYDETNREWKAIQLRQNIPGQPGLNKKKQAMFYMASYDMDKFRRFVFESSFLDTFDIEKETVEKLKTDDVELIHLGCKYIQYFMMLKQTLKVRKDKLNSGKEK